MGFLRQGLRRQDGLLDVHGHVEFVFQGDQAVPGFERLLHRVDVVQGLVDGDFQVVEVDRLGYEVEGAPVHGGADVLHVTVGGDDDGADFRVRVFELAQERQAVHHRHVDVGEDQADVRVFGESVQGFLAVVGEDEVDLALADGAAEFLADEQFQVFFVVDDEQAGDGRHEMQVLSS